MFCCDQENEEYRQEQIFHPRRSNYKMNGNGLQSTNPYLMQNTPSQTRHLSQTQLPYLGAYQLSQGKKIQYHQHLIAKQNGQYNYALATEMKCLKPGTPINSLLDLNNQYKGNKQFAPTIEPSGSFFKNKTLLY